MELIHGNILSFSCDTTGQMFTSLTPYTSYVQRTDDPHENGGRWSDGLSSRDTRRLLLTLPLCDTFGVEHEVIAQKKKKRREIFLRDNRAVGLGPTSRSYCLGVSFLSGVSPIRTYIGYLTSPGFPVTSGKVFRSV